MTRENLTPPRKPERSVADVVIAHLSIVDFGRRMRGLARGLWAGEIDDFEFTDSFLSAMERGFEQAWTEGARTCGIEPGERTDEEATRLNEYIFSQAPYVPGLADWIAAHNRESDSKLAPILSRIEIWTNRYNEVMGIAQQLACADQKMKWTTDPAKDSCRDCIGYHGRVHRMSVWAKYDIRPQHPSLACGGLKCGCGWAPTNDPVTPGRPAGMSGG